MRVPIKGQYLGGQEVLDELERASGGDVVAVGQREAAKRPQEVCVRSEKALSDRPAKLIRVIGIKTAAASQGLGGRRCREVKELAGLGLGRRRHGQQE